MRRILVLVVLAGVVACGSKKKDDGGSGSSTEKAVEPPAMKCPPGNVVENGACVVAITAEKIEVVAQQQSRLDELATLLDKVEVAAAPIELLNAFRQLDQWKAFAAKFEELRAVEQVVATLDTAVKQLRAFKGSLGEASGRLGNLKGELDRLLADPGNAKQLAEVRTRVSSELRGALEPLAKDVSETIQNGLTPLVAQLGEWSDLIITACTLGKATGGGAKLKELCTQAKDVFGQATTYLADLKTRPAKLYEEVSAKLETELALLVDAESKKLIAATQEQVNAALKLPPAGATAGSAASPTP